MDLLSEPDPLGGETCESGTTEDDPGCDDRGGSPTSPHTTKSFPVFVRPGRSTPARERRNKHDPGKLGVQYALKTEELENGAGTYRLIQVTDGSMPTLAVGSLETTNVMPHVLASNSLNAMGDVIQTESIAVEPTRFAYITAPAPGAPNGPTHLGIPAEAAAAAENGTLAITPNGQLYVIGQVSTPTDTLGPRIAPRSVAVDNSRVHVRDERRRATHNEVERRRRDKINTWILKLGNIIPDCQTDASKPSQSKGGILAKACDYIVELRETCVRLHQEVQELSDMLSPDVRELRKQIQDLRNENAILRNLAHDGVLEKNSEHSNSSS
ncbi:unnamed protein product [Darwinula stevensoni]|uniref:BHLH domain-containing protein n=1 Tax=Darwinula stevensoni TaxID=69355 RepID=A0A7R8XC33_9CRUS|nr:unnamed protein product [Darwinula stevensoni]CAG0887095.1 unnamed protein product [Darwinula stevensoni]